jgi:hypothetical protein
LGTWGILQKDDENMLGTHWEQGRKTKKITPPTPPPKEKNRAHDDECMMNFGNILGVFGVQNWGRSRGGFEGTKHGKIWG